jgi:hypothetical protein
VLPNGNYPVLAALGHGYRCRKPPDIDKCLDILSDHLSLTEHVAVWRTLVYDLSVLGAASNRRKAVDFLNRLSRAYPETLASFEGTVFLARSHRWLFEEFLHQCLSLIEDSNWRLKEQAVGEISMLRRAAVRNDDYFRFRSQSSHFCSDRRFHSHRSPPGWDRIRLYQFVGEPEFRERSHEVLIQLARAADGHLPRAVMDLFRVDTNMAPDEKTKELLTIVAENPELICCGVVRLSDRSPQRTFIGWL